MAQEAKKATVITPEMSEDLAAYLALTEQIELLQKQADTLKDNLKAYTAAAGGQLSLDGHKLTLSAQTRTTISYAELVAAHPRLAKKFGKATTYSVFRIK